MAPRSRKSLRDELRREFVFEAEGILERMREELSALEALAAAGREALPEAMNRLLRSAHSLKGLSGMFGHTALSELAHHLEDVLDRLRRGRTSIGPDGLALLDESLALAATGLEKVGRGEAADASNEAIADLVGRIAAWDARPSAPRDAVEPPAQRLRALTGYGESRLHELANLDVRSVPLRRVFDKLARGVRRLHLALGKDVRLEIQGADTRLDERIVEHLVDPLVHLVRNAIDHAIEPAPERASRGKPRQGVIRIEAWQQGHEVAVRVCDDGRGIDPEQVRARAVERGLLPPDAAPSCKEAFELLFLPGFSTRSQVTETSGRGVGLDVVRANVAALGGHVDLDSTPGTGTAVKLTLPITPASRSGRSEAPPSGGSAPGRPETLAVPRGRGSTRRSPT